MTQFTDEVREILSPYKFGNDRRAAAMYLADLDGMQDEYTGDAIEWGLFVARYGRNLLFVQDNGFVESAKCADEREARSRFDAIEEQYLSDTAEEEPPAGFVSADSVAISSFLPGDTCRVAGYGGVAWRIIGLPVWKGSDYDWSGLEYQDPDRRELHMVGDDRTFTFEVSELEPLADGEYCQDCGQIGCGWHV